MVNCSKQPNGNKRANQDQTTIDQSKINDENGIDEGIYLNEENLEESQEAYDYTDLRNKKSCQKAALFIS